MRKGLHKNGVIDICDTSEHIDYTSNFHDKERVNMQGQSWLKTVCIALWLLLTMITGVNADDTPDSLTEEGKSALFVDGNITTATTKFNAALLLDSTHKKAHFWQAVASIFNTSDLIEEFEGLTTLSNQTTPLIFGVHTISEIDAALEHMSAVYVDTYNAHQERTSTNSYPITINDYTGWVKHAIRVRAESSFTTDRIALNLKQLGTAPGNLTIKVCASTTDTNYPDDSTVFASKTIPCSEVPTSFSWVDFTFDTPIDLTELTVYWIVIETDYAQSSPGYIQVNTFFTPSGNWTFSNGTAWQPYSSYPYEAYYRIFKDPGDAVLFTETFQVDGTGDVITLDYADAAAIYSKMLYIKMLIYIGNAYGVNNQTVQQVIDIEKFDMNTFLTTYQNAFTLSGSASNELANAKDALLGMINAYMDCSDFIRNTRSDDDGLKHFFRFYNPYSSSSSLPQSIWTQYKKEKLWNEQDKRQLFTDIKANLLSPGSATAVSMAFPDNEGDPDLYVKYQWNFGAFFDYAPNIDQYMDEFIVDGTFVQGNYSDVTIGGLFVNITVADWNHLSGNACEFTIAKVEWENDSPAVSFTWDVPNASGRSFINYKLYRSTSPDVDDTSTLLATINDKVVYNDTTIPSEDTVYYYRLYTYYRENTIVTSTYSDTKRMYVYAYIDAANNDDPNQTGSKEHPFSSLTVPIEEKMQIGARVRIAEGTYYGTSVSTYIFYQNLHIYGGYESGTWERDIKAHETILDGSNLSAVLYISQVTGVTIDGITIVPGSGCNNGIAMNSSYTATTGDNHINNCTIRDMASVGIGVWNTNIALIENCELDNCGYYGIQVYVSESVFIDECTAKNCGYAGISLQGSSGYYSDTIFVLNSTVENNDSNGINVSYCDNVYINQCIIKENTEVGIYIEVSGASVSNCLIRNNNSEGILCLTSSVVTILNNTIVQNAGAGGLVYTTSVQSLEVNNNIIAFNNNGWGQAGIYATGTLESAVITYNNSYANTGGDYYQCGTEADNDGNISVDPQFYNPNSVINPIYRLAYGSPCIDVADNDSYYMALVDLDQSPRIINGTIDMGAYEYYDTDNDGLPNQWESDHGLDPNVNDANGDADNDGVSNINEYLAGSDPDVWNADPPSIIDLSISHLGGEMPVSFTLIDVQDDICSIEMQYKEVGGVYMDATVIGDTTGLTSNQQITITWDSSADLPDAVGESYYIRVRAQDTTGAGEWKSYGPLWVLNTYEITIEPCLFKYYAGPSDAIQIALKLKNTSDADIALSPMVIFSGSVGQYQGTVTNVPFTLNAGKRETNIIAVTAPSQTGVFYVDIYLTEDSTGHLKGVQEGDHLLTVTSTDSDNDGMPDSWEIYAGTNPAINDAAFDNDGDSLTCLLEFVYGTDPMSTDSDNDGQLDGHEYIAGTNPIDPESLFKLVAPGGVFDIGEDGIIDQLSWTCETGVAYRIYWSDLPSNGNWYVVNYNNWANDIQENGDGIKTWTYNNQDMILNNYARFFKIVVDED